MTKAEIKARLAKVRANVVIVQLKAKSQRVGISETSRLARLSTACEADIKAIHDELWRLESKI